MRGGVTIAVIVPALDEAEAIARVIAAIPGWVDRIIVADNGSTDGTGRIAAEAGAEVIGVPRRGYGSACMAGIAAAEGAGILVFLDGDLSDYPERMDALVDPILARSAVLVIGSRVLGGSEPGALTTTQRFGNWLACGLIRRIWGVTYTDLGPFRALSAPALAALGMRDPDFGWTVEMQIKAARQGLATLEVPVAYRRRVGRSKISGTLRGSLAAGTKILTTIACQALAR